MRPIVSGRGGPQNRKGQSWGIEMKRSFMVAVVLNLAIALGCFGLRVAPAANLDFAGDDFVILDGSTGEAIGSVHYTVDSSAPGHQTVTSLARYNDGTYDVERDEFDTAGHGELPVMFDYDHTFYKPNGSVFLLAKADFHHGNAACTSYSNGEPNALKETIQFPADTYAGAAVMLPMRKALRDGTPKPIELYDFVCIPGPKLVKVAASPEPLGTWDHYPGALVRTSIKPDLGLLSFVINPFLPEMYAWFNPSNGFDFVGGRFARYYKGPQIIFARKPASPPATASNSH